MFWESRLVYLVFELSVSLSLLSLSRPSSWPCVCDWLSSIASRIPVYVGYNIKHMWKIHYSKAPTSKIKFYDRIFWQAAFHGSITPSKVHLKKLNTVLTWFCEVNSNSLHLTWIQAALFNKNIIIYIWKMM